MKLTNAVTYVMPRVMYSSLGVKIPDYMSLLRVLLESGSSCFLCVPMNYSLSDYMFMGCYSSHGAVTCDSMWKCRPSINAIITSL